MITPLRRGLTALTSLAVASAGLAGLTATSAGATQEAPDPGVAALTTEVSGASFTWGISGYAQDGIFGPWVFKDLTGGATYLEGSIGSGTQTEYVVDPVPATSMPASDPQKTPNAVKFTGGTGTADAETGEAELAWTGSYTINAYPPMFGAPDEIYSDPQLSIDGDGAGELTMDLVIGAGVDILGNPTEAVEVGRVPLMEYDAGAADRIAGDAFRLTPEYQGVEVEVEGSEQVRSCTTDGGATGWWGSWPEEFVAGIAESVRPHFYSTGCGGKQDNKPPLPADVDFGLGTSVEVAQTDLLPSGQFEVTVSGTGFDPSLAIGTRPPFSGVESGVYIAFGRYLDVWRPSEDAPSSARKNPAGENGTGVAVKWAVPASSFPGPFNQDPESPAYTELGTDGSFSTTIQVDQSWLAEEPGNFGIYTYAGGGPKVASYETYTPITFTKATPDVTVVAPSKKYGQPASAGVSVLIDGESPAEGTVTFTRGDQDLGTAELADGAAVVGLGRPGAGRYPLTVSYAGDVNTADASGSAVLKIAKATSRTKPKLTRAPQVNRSGKALLRVTSPTTKVSGQAKVQLRKSSGKLVKLISTRVSKGKKTVSLPPLAKGSYKLVVRYLGNKNIAGSAKTITFRVR